MLKLMFITNSPEVAMIAQEAGVDRIWIDLETLGKELRQKNMNTVKSRHSIDDIRAVAPLLSESELLVRVNPWNANSEREINEVIAAGADIIMLPYWKSYEEVRDFLSFVNGRCRTLLLLETREAAECLDRVLELPRVDEMHIGLNDLRISYGYKDMFEPFANGMLDSFSQKIREAGIPFGIGGIGQFGLGLSPSPEELIIEHYRLGSKAVILSRTFCNVEKLGDLHSIKKTLTRNVGILRETEHIASMLDENGYRRNHIAVMKALGFWRDDKNNESQT